MPPGGGSEGGLAKDHCFSGFFCYLPLTCLCYSGTQPLMWIQPKNNWTCYLKQSFSLFSICSIKRQYLNECFVNQHQCTMATFLSIIPLYLFIPLYLECEINIFSQLFPCIFPFIPLYLECKIDIFLIPLYTIQGNFFILFPCI